MDSLMSNEETTSTLHAPRVLFLSLAAYFHESCRKKKKKKNIFESTTLLTKYMEIIKRVHWLLGDTHTLSTQYDWNSKTSAAMYPTSCSPFKVFQSFAESRSLKTLPIRILSIKLNRKNIRNVSSYFCVVLVFQNFPQNEL